MGGCPATGHQKEGDKSDIVLGFWQDFMFE